MEQQRPIKNGTADEGDEGRDFVMINDENDELILAPTFNVNDDNMDDDNIACAEKFRGMS